MPLNATAKNEMLTHFAGIATHMSLHSASPATTGNEIAGGNPVYARIPITWGTASNGAIGMTNDPVFNVPSGVTVQAVGYFSALSGGTFYGYDDVTPESYAGQGTYTVTASDIDLNAV